MLGGLLFEWHKIMQYKGKHYYWSTHTLTRSVIFGLCTSMEVLKPVNEPPLHCIDLFPIDGSVLGIQIPIVAPGPVSYPKRSASVNTVMTE